MLLRKIVKNVQLSVTFLQHPNFSSMAFNQQNIGHLHKLIDTFCMDKYYLNYNDFFSNHLGHGQIALFRLGDSLKHIEEFSKKYASHLEPKGGQLNQRDDASVPKRDSIEELRGKGAHFYFILDHFKSLLATTYSNNLDEMIPAEFPKLSDGIGDSALHPLIHIGYGYSAKSSTMVCEGLAYLHHSYFPLILTSKSADKLGNFNNSKEKAYFDLRTIPSN